MNCKTIDQYFDVFFVKMQLKKLLFGRQSLAG